MLGDPEGITAAESFCDVFVVEATLSPAVLLVGETVTGSVSMIPLCVGPLAPLNAVVVWEPPRGGASFDDAVWRKRVREYVSGAVTNDELGVPRASAVAATLVPASGCDSTTSRAELEACLSQLDAAGEPDLAKGLAQIGPRRAAMRDALSRTLGLREWVVVIGDAAGPDDCAALAAEGALIEADGVDRVGAICATPQCRRDCLEGLTGSPGSVVDAHADFDGLLHALRNNTRGMKLFIESGEIRFAMGEGGRIETTHPSAGVVRSTARSMVWRHGRVPYEGITMTWTARALRPGYVDWMSAMNFVVTDTLGIRYEQTRRPLPNPGLVLAPVLWPDQGGQIWLPVAVR